MRRKSACSKGRNLAGLLVGQFNPVGPKSLRDFGREGVGREKAQKQSRHTSIYTAESSSGSFDTEMAFDKEWLKKALAKELGWDLGTLDGIVEAIQAANGQSEVDEIVQDYLGGSLAVKRFVEQYLATGRGANKSARPVGASYQRFCSSARLLCTVVLKVCQQCVFA